MPDEKTPIIPASIPGPSYVFPGKPPSIRERNTQRFKCCICTGLLAAGIIALIIAMSYAILEPLPAPIETIDDNRNDTNYTTNVIINPSDVLPTSFFVVFPLTDEPQTNWSTTQPTEQDVKEALDAGKIALGDREMIEENVASPALNTPSFRAQKASATSLDAKEVSKQGYVEDRATKFLANKYGFNRQYHKRSDIGIGPKTKLVAQKDAIDCNFFTKFRTIDGTCNNKKNPKWGSALIPFRRMMNPDYCDGISTPRCAIDGTELSSAREISTQIHRPSYFTEQHFTVMLAVWGQFLDHDITATAINSAVDGVPIECCDDRQPKHPECYPVPLGKGDPNFDKYNLTCMNFVRSIPAPTDHFGPRQQLNQATAFIDGSTVYGPTDKKAATLRTWTDGKLKMYITKDNRALLPVSTDPQDGCNEEAENAKGRYCFASGDDRANENLHLTSMHLIFARHHNYLVDKLAEMNPHFDDERLFEEARKILGAQMQHITYNEFLPVVFGKESSENFGILPSPGEKVDPYDETLDPSMANIFVAAAFRFAHTLLPGLMKITKEFNDTEESIDLHKLLFNPFSLYSPEGLDISLKTAINNPLEKADPFFTTELTQNLFVTDASPQLCGLDLVSLNIQRGRDHGLPAYPYWRKKCGLPAVDTWEQFEKAVDPDSFKKIKEIYKVPQDVDPYTGGLSEPPVKGGLLGPTFTCLIGDQFVRLRKGDSFWYERSSGPQRFTTDQLEQIYGTTLSSIICRNSDNVQGAQNYVMKKGSKTNPFKDCSELDTFNFEPWRDMNNNKYKLRTIKMDSMNSKVKSIKN